jgi:DNA-binding NarL/FixJ family response regulator
MIQVLVMENHNLFRIALQFAFSSYPNIHLAGDAGNGDDLLRLLAATPADVVLISVNPPDIGYAHIVRLLRRDYPAVKIFAFTNEDTYEILQSMIDAGIDGYVGKRHANGEILTKAIQTVAEGGIYEGKIEP